MAVNRHRFYVGPVGAMVALPAASITDLPRMTMAIPGQEHRSLSGAGTMDRVGRARRAWGLSSSWLTEDEELAAQAAIRRSANAALRMYDPRKRNSLPEDMSTGGSITRSVSAFTDVGAATPLFVSGDVPTAFQGLLAGGISWPGVTTGQQLWGTFERHPLLAGSTYRFSAYAKGSTTFRFGVRPYNLSGVEQATVLDATTNTATGVWQRFSWLYTPAVDVFSAYFGIQATGSGTIQTTGWLVQTDEALKNWTFGYGCPEVAASFEVSMSYWRTKYHNLAVVFEEL